jgi:hypothetical protein
LYPRWADLRIVLRDFDPEPVDALGNLLAGQ